MNDNNNHEIVLPEKFRPNHNYDLIRIGKENDGGYLVSKKSLNNSELLISAGISWDYSFESDYINLTNNRVKCFDHTVNSQHYFFTWLAIFLKRILFFSGYKKIKSAFQKIMNPIKLKNFIKRDEVDFYYVGVGIGDERYMSLKEIIKRYSENKKIFLKIDIEGDEYRLLNDLIENSNQLSGLVIEFHYVDINLEKIKNFLSTFELKLVHTHINNAGPISNNIPSLIECSFAKNPEILGDFKNQNHILDQPNIKNKQNYSIKFK
tara:strand:+ start:18 stop:809 length:792 start_codon:yes stop_codon:yes gene_type:complete